MWQVAGGQYQVAGVRCQVAGGRCQVAGGTHQPLRRHIYPALGGAGDKARPRQLHRLQGDYFKIFE